jgi:hypothetical protein
MSCRAQQRGVRSSADGKVTRITDFADRDAALAAAGLA